MYAALIANMAWLDEELPGFRHLVVGLMDEQARVAQVLPRQLPTDEASVFGEYLTWTESRWWPINHFRIARLRPRLQELGVNLVHALDGRIWLGAVRLADTMGVPAILTVNSTHDVRLVERTARFMKPARVAFTATTEPLAEAIRDRLGQEYLVEVVHPGAHGGEPVRAPATDEAICVAVSGNGRMDEHYDALLEAVGRVIRRHPQVQFFFDGQGSDQHKIWAEASGRGLLSNMSLIPRRVGHRELLLRADILAHPQPLGRSRSLTLQAMAQGVPVIAHEDPWLDYLVDNETAWVVPAADAISWAGQLNRAIEQPDEAQRLGQRARVWVNRHRLASDRITRTLDLYRRLTGDTLKFPGPEPQTP